MCVYGKPEESLGLAGGGSKIRSVGMGWGSGICIAVHGEDGGEDGERSTDQGMNTDVPGPCSRGERPGEHFLKHDLSRDSNRPGL